MTLPMTDVQVRGTCPHDCPDGCAWIVTVRDGRAVSVVGDPEHPFTRGGLCTKVNHLLDDRVYGRGRLRHPLRRTGPKGSGEFERISWDEAIELVSGAVRSAVRRRGPESVVSVSSGGTMGWLQGAGMSRRFFARLGATQARGEVCGANGFAALEATIGTPIALVPDEVRHSRYIVLWGTNTLTTNLHLWPFIREARERNGAKLVVIDPVRTRTAAAADVHLRPRPGTDAALALGMMHVIVAEGLHDEAYVRDHTVGFEALRERLADYPPDVVAGITGMDADAVVRFARDYATSQPSLIKLQIGLEHTLRGGAAFRAVSCLPGLVGAWRHRGGGLACVYFPLDEADDSMGHEPPLTQRRSFTIAQLGRMLVDRDLDPPLDVAVVYNSNPVVTLPRQNAIVEGLSREDLFTVVLEHTMTDTARYADVLLPATTQLEHWDLGEGWGHSYAHLNVPAIAPVGEALPNTEVFRRLAAALGFDDAMFRQTDEEMVRAAVAAGPPALSAMPFDELVRRGWVDLRPDDPTPFASGGFPTPSGKVEFYSESLERAGRDPLPGHLPLPDDDDGDADGAAGPDGQRRYPLRLMSPKTAHHFLNSSYANVDRQLRAEREPLVELSAADASVRGIADGDLVRVFNGRGTLTLHCRVGDVVGAGVVAVPSGWWMSHSPGGRTVNALVPDAPGDYAGAGAFHGTRVEVEPA
jgi:anaerobic selenocysteine-containing dehydrogenase